MSANDQVTGREVLYGNDRVVVSQSLEYVGFHRNPTHFFMATAFSGRGYPIVLCTCCGTVTTVTVPVLQPVASWPNLGWPWQGRSSGHMTDVKMPSLWQRHKVSRPIIT